VAASQEALPRISVAFNYYLPTNKFLRQRSLAEQEE